MPRQAPSGRELPTESGEVERAKVKQAKSQGRAGSFHHFVVPLPPGGRLKNHSHHRDKAVGNQPHCDGYQINDFLAKNSVFCGVNISHNGVLPFINVKGEKQ